MLFFLFRAEDAIFKCISAALNECGQTSDAEVARDMLLETAQTVRSMCELRSASGKTKSPCYIRLLWIFLLTFQYFHWGLVLQVLLCLRTILA